MGRFAGDVFTYLDNRQPIIDRVLADVDNALAARRAGDDEIYLVGHSFGGIILYDILTHFRPDIPCHLYVTVGSQVALFAEMGRLVDKDTIAAAFGAGTATRCSVAPVAERWINILSIELTHLALVRGGYMAERTIFNSKPTHCRSFRTLPTSAPPVFMHGSKSACVRPFNMALTAKPRKPAAKS